MRDIFLLDNINKGKINIIGAITSFDVDNWIDVIDRAVEVGNKTITLHITSPGGEVYASYALYDHLRMVAKSGVKIEAVVNGYAASAAAAIVLQAADVRKCMPSARLLLHEVSRWAFGPEKTSDLLDEAKELKVLTDMIVNTIAKKSKKSIKEVMKLIERKEVWFSAQEALEWGLVDEIVE